MDVTLAASSRQSVFDGGSAVDGSNGQILGARHRDITKIILYQQHILSDVLALEVQREVERSSPASLSALTCVPLGCHGDPMQTLHFRDWPVHRFSLVFSPVICGCRYCILFPLGKAISSKCGVTHRPLFGFGCSP